MIKSSELMIGNVIRDDSGDYVIVKSIKENSADLLFEDLLQENVNLINCEGLLVDKYWLLKLGFEERNGFVDLFWLRKKIKVDKNRKIQTISKTICQVKYNGKTCQYYLGSEQNSNKIDAVYIHQLQNIYYCLTSEELTLKQ